MEPSIRVMMMPRETNGQGTIFGGVLLSYIDQAGAIAAQRCTAYRVVTVALEKVEFKQSVLVGDVVSFYGTVIKKGRTSLTIDVSVVAERMHNGVSAKSTSPRPPSSSSPSTNPATPSPTARSSLTRGKLGGQGDGFGLQRRPKRFQARLTLEKASRDQSWRSALGRLPNLPRLPGPLFAFRRGHASA